MLLPPLLLLTPLLTPGDETMPYATSHLDHAATTKCLAEKTVLEANGQLWNGHQLWTCALRPEMIFGPGDNHFVPQILDKVTPRALLLVCPAQSVLMSVYVGCTDGCVCAVC